MPTGGSNTGPPKKPITGRPDDKRPPSFPTKKPEREKRHITT